MLSREKQTISIKPLAYPNVIIVGFVLFIWFYIFLFWLDGIVRFELTWQWVGGIFATIILLGYFSFGYLQSRSREIRYEQGQLIFKNKDTVKSVRVNDLSDIVWFLSGARVGVPASGNLLYVVFSRKGSLEPELWMLGSPGTIGEQWPVLRIKVLIEKIQKELKATENLDFPLQDAVGPALQSVVPSLGINRVITNDTKKFFQDALRK